MISSAGELRVPPNFGAHQLTGDRRQQWSLTVTEAAARLRVTRQAMSNLLNGKAGLSAEMAIRFEKAFGLSAATLLRMQGSYELSVARGREDEILVERVAG